MLSSMSIRGSFEVPLTHVREVPLNRRCRCHHRTDKVCAPPASLSPFKISVTRRRTALARLKNVGIHPETHRTSRLAPFKPRFVENPIETFELRGFLNVLRTRHNHRTHR